MALPEQVIEFSGHFGELEGMVKSEESKVYAKREPLWRILRRSIVVRNHSHRAIE